MIELSANRCATYCMSSCHAMATTEQDCTAQVCTEEPEREGGGLKAFE